MIGVEFDPEVAHALRREGLVVRYGDSLVPEFLETLPLARARWIVSTLPTMDSTIDLLRGLRELHFAGGRAVVAREGFDPSLLATEGATNILEPMRDAVERAVEVLGTMIRPAAVTP